MLLINIEILDQSIRKHAELRNAILTWKAIVEKQLWNTPHELINTFPKASNIGKNKWWFDLNFGGYRLLATINFAAKIVKVESIHKHKEYLKLSKTMKP